MANGILVAAFDFSNAHEDEFHDWYDLEHVPEREALPGFRRCERWIGVDNPKLSIATYDLDTVEVLDSAPYKAVAYDNLSAWSKRIGSMCKLLSRGEGILITPGEQDAPAGAGGLLLNAMDVAPEHEADFNKWYDEEHIPALGAVPGTLAARRYRTRVGSHRYFAIYHLTEPGVAQGAAWKRAASSAWTDRVSPNFNNRLRILARAYKR